MPLTIGALGRLTKRKGFDILIDAVARLTMPCRLMIAGEGSERGALEAQAHRLGITVEFPGWIGNEDKGDFLDSLDIFVCPSRFEPFGNVYLEAMQHGLPVVTTPTTGARAIFARTDAARITADDSAEHLATALETLAKDQTLRERLGQAGQAHYLAAYSLEAAGPVLARAVESAVAQFHARPKAV
jgi:glycosyltransferase involved in cell wall biosynthesis